ncbi:MAG: ATP-binding protein [Gammaproteobacteria bacterium]|nr:ATP-binding protein [Gammaproteobacteria bacterium]
MKAIDLQSCVSEFDEVDYCRFYALMESPFGHEFDVSKFYRGANRISVLEDILLQIRNDDPFVFVRAEPGSGKTAICRMTEHDLQQGLCLYANCSGRARTVSLEKQLAEGLLIDVRAFVPVTHLERAIVHKLETHERLIILLEGIRGIAAEQFDWLRELQTIVRDKGKNLTLVFLYSDYEQSLLEQNGFDTSRRPIHIESLTDYEVYEYLNDHMRLCGHGGLPAFTRETAKTIAGDSAGNFRKLVELANGTLRRAYRRNAEIPAVYDVPVTQDAVQLSQSPAGGAAALLTARNSLLVGAISGGLVLALIWTMFGNVGSSQDLVSVNNQNMLVIRSEEKAGTTPVRK